MELRCRDAGQVSPLPLRAAGAYHGDDTDGRMEVRPDVQDFELSSAVRDGTFVVSLSGDLDIVTSRQLDETLTQARRKHSNVVLDLSAVDFMDTSSLAVIVSHWKGLQAAGGSLSLAGARYQYTRTLWITGLASRIPMFDTVDLAVADGQEPAPAGADPQG